jgi:hypothetical protein
MLTLKKALILFGLCLLAAISQQAQAGYDCIQQDVTIPLGASSATSTITLQRSRITDVIVDAPLVDAGDGTSLTLRVAFTPLTGTAKQTYTPRTWVDKGLSGTQDGAVVLCSATALDINVDSFVVLGATCTTTQTVARTFRFRIMRER